MYSDSDKELAFNQVDIIKHKYENTAFSDFPFDTHILVSHEEDGQDTDLYKAVIDLGDFSVTFVVEVDVATGAMVCIDIGEYDFIKDGEMYECVRR